MKTLTSGRIEFIVENTIQKTQLIEQRQYGHNNRLLGTIKLPAVQTDLVMLDFLIINGMKFSDIRKRYRGQKLIVIHLRRVDASETVILLDIDNGPSAMTHSANSRLYRYEGIMARRYALRKKGMPVRMVCGAE